MAKRKISGSESELAATGAVPARRPRKRTVKSASNTSPLPPADAVATAPDTTSATAPAAEAVAAPQAASQPAEYTPSFDEIARVAYSYWVSRGCQGGSAEDDWLRAERELRTRRSFEANA